MKQLQTPDGDLITGILEIVPGNCLVNGFHVDSEGNLEPEYFGETKMWWDEQKEVTQVDDMSKMPWSNIPNYGVAYICKFDSNDPIYLDGHGNEWRLKDLTIIDDTNEQAETRPVGSVSDNQKETL
jgi:hypothetical protein